MDWYTNNVSVPFAYTTNLRGSDFLLPPINIVPSGEEMWKAHEVAVDKVMELNKVNKVNKVNNVNTVNRVNKVNKFNKVNKDTIMSLSELLLL
jgi:hypothetical protein